MRTYRVVNLAPAQRTPRSMGQAREVEVLSDQVLARLCAAIDDYNNADTSWSSPDVDAAERTQRDATAAVQSVIDGVPANLKNAAIWEIRKYCPDADAVLDTVVKPGPGTPPAIPSSPTMVPSVDRYIKPDVEEPPQPVNPPVASTDRWFPGGRRPQPPPPPPPAPVATGGNIPFFTGSEPQPEPEPPTIQTYPPQPPPPQPPPPPPPPVATPSVGCWYVMGQGYMWGPRPAGGESTGLNQKDCEALMARDLEVRTGQPQLTQQAQCDTARGQFIDPRTGQCRGSVSSFPGAPFGFTGDTGGVAAPTLSGPRRVALRGANSNGNLEWWSYQQAFLPPLFFARRRANYATLGVGKPVPEGLCCQATEDGGVICSDGHGFPPDCSNKPEPNVPGVAERIAQEGYLVPKPPPAPVNGVCPLVKASAPERKAEEAGGIPPLVGIAAVGALVYALVESL